MSQHDPEADQVRDDDSTLGLDEEELAIIRGAAADPDRVVVASPPHKLGYFSVMMVIVNRMIGTGIFNANSTIMYETQSVGWTLMFWLLGSVCSLAGAMCFIEYGLTIPRWDWRGEKIFTPRSGGELNYFNYLLKSPKFLATCIFGVSFILIGNSAANGLSFGIHVLDAAGYTSDNTDNFDNLARGLGIIIITAVCVLHGLWRRIGLLINNLFGSIKLAILVMIIVLGILSLYPTIFPTDPPTASPANSNLNPATSFANPQKDAQGYARAYLDIIFAFGGFNQANYILGEIDQPRRKFKKSAVSAVSIVCILYVLVNISYMLVVPALDQKKNGSSVSLEFFQSTLGRVSSNANAARILYSFMAFSSLGNIIVTTYTAARVKQEIAKEGVLPFSKFFARNHDILKRFLSSPPPDYADKTPVGTLFLHWIFSVVLILATWKVSTSDAYTTLVDIYSYTIDASYGVCLGVGILWLRLHPGSKWHTKSPISGFVSITAALIFTLSNAFPIVVSWIPPSVAFVTSIPWYLTPLIGWTVLFAGLVYWLFFVGVVPRVGSHAGKELVVEKAPFFRMEDRNRELVQVCEIVTFDWLAKA